MNNEDTHICDLILDVYALKKVVDATEELNKLNSEMGDGNVCDRVVYNIEQIITKTHTQKEYIRDLEYKIWQRDELLREIEREKYDGFNFEIRKTLGIILD